MLIHTNKLLLNAPIFESLPREVAYATDTEVGVAIDGTVSPAGWDTIAAETPSIDVRPDGTVSVYYAGHNLGQTNFEIGLMNNITNGVASSGDPVPAMVAIRRTQFFSPSLRYLGPLPLGRGSWKTDFLKILSKLPYSPKA